MDKKQHDNFPHQPAKKILRRRKELATAPDWTEREWFEVWLRMARRSYPPALR